MQRRDKTALKKIISEINITFEILGDTVLEEFLKNELIKRATAMTAINIGELVKNLTPELRLENNDVEWKKIAGLRDIAAHKYATLDMEQVYFIVKKDFPELKAQIEKILVADES